MKLRPALRRLRGYGFRAVPFSIALIPLLAATGADAGVVVWTGAGGSKLGKRKLEPVWAGDNGYGELHRHRLRLISGNSHERSERHPDDRRAGV